MELAAALLVQVERWFDLDLEFVHDIFDLLGNPWSSIKLQVRLKLQGAECHFPHFFVDVTRSIGCTYFALSVHQSSKEPGVRCCHTCRWI